MAFQSSSFPCSSLSCPTLLPKVCSTAAAPQAMHDAGGTHPPLFSSRPQYPSPFPSRYDHGSSSTHSLSPHHGMPVPSNPPPFFSSLHHHHHPPHYLQGSSSTHSLSPHHGMPVPSNPPPFFSSLHHHHHHHPPHYLHESSSTHYLSPDHGMPVPSNPPFFSSPHDHHRQPFFFSSSSGDNLDFGPGPVPGPGHGRSDLQNGMQASGNNYSQEGTAIPGCVGRCGPDERQEKIKRYRSKRSRRNFDKKITYPCRKTLADSRPRVCGRFARNGETQTERNPQVEAEVTENNYNNCEQALTSDGGGTNGENSYKNHEQALTSGGGGTNGNGDWLTQIETALMTEDVDSGDPLWAGFDDTFDKNPSEDFFS